MKRLLLALCILLCPVQARASSESMAFFLSDNVVTTVSPSVTTSSVVIVQANPRRRGIIIYNNSANSAYLTYGLTSASNTCTRILATFTQFEMLGPVVYTGAIAAIRNAGSGTLIITELQ